MRYLHDLLVVLPLLGFLGDLIKAQFTTLLSICVRDTYFGGSVLEFWSLLEVNGACTKCSHEICRRPLSCTAVSLVF